MKNLANHAYTPLRNVSTTTSMAVPPLVLPRNAQHRSSRGMASTSDRHGATRNRQFHMYIRYTTVHIHLCLMGFYRAMYDLIIS
jgi:hypothetical protein